jgi:molybdopterin-guanine dinucleotide biosynthesis protein B
MKNPSQPNPPKLVSFVGRSNSGKTTLVTSLIPRFKELGLTIGTIKNTHHDVEFDNPGKDSWKYAQSGSDRVLVSSGKKLAVYSDAPADKTLKSLVADWFDGFDLVISEGFKNEDCFKIEVFRSETGKTPLYQDPTYQIQAVISDIPPTRNLPYFEFQESDRLIAWICQKLQIGRSC